MSSIVIPAGRREGRAAVAFRRLSLAVRIVVAAAAIAIAAAVIWEMQTFAIQAHQFAALAARADYKLVAGPSTAIRFPEGGPYDVRLGYALIPDFTKRLRDTGFEIERQASFSQRLLTLVSWGVSPLYREKTQAGLSIAGADGRLLFATQHPDRVYEDFDAIPRIVIDSLLFVENRELLDPNHPRRNPAVEWDRLAHSALALGLDRIDRSGVVPGGSTLATQIEKYRHSPGGVTSSPREKLRQMLTASLRAYRNGDDTTETRKQIVVDYINSVSLAAVRGLGEVTGIPEGLSVWYGADFRTTSAILQWPRPGSIDIGPQARAKAYKQVLSLLLAARRPTDYLVRHSNVLEQRTNTYLDVLAANGVIPQELRDYGRDIDLDLRPRVTASSSSGAMAKEVVSPIRSRLAGRLGVTNYYELDRLDLAVESTLDGETQRAIIQALQDVRDPEHAAKLGLRGYHLLEDSADPSRLIYSFSLYETLGDRNVLRVQADNNDAAFNVNEFVRLDLGSTAKLRTLVTYLDVMSALHLRFAGHPRTELRVAYAAAKDNLTRWALERLELNPAESLEEFLTAAMARRYSASPHEQFFTGGGLHFFRNFDKTSDAQVMSVETAFHNSVNLVFIRMMRDIAHYYMFGPSSEGTVILADAKHPLRQAYLEHFAEVEGRVFINRFYNRLRGKDRDEILDQLTSDKRLTPTRLATILRTYEPEADAEAFRADMERFVDADKVDVPGVALTLPAEELDRLYLNYDPERFTLADLGYLAKVHPLELWVARYLREHPKASLSEVAQASTQARLDVYAWLFKTRHKRAQDVRIRQLLERQAFDRVLENWKSYGYPFDNITPSYASSIGAAGDRPSALAELVGIIVNNGRRLPMQRIDRLRFAEGTPYETILKPRETETVQVMAPEVASVVRHAMVGVVEGGTARRAAGSLTDAAGKAHVIGGKTGTGDHVYRTFNASGHEIDSHSVSRAATFVYFIDQRWFGVITAYVTGQEAAEYSFTSALPVQLFRSLASIISPATSRSVTAPAVDTANSEPAPPTPSAAVESRG